MHRIWTLFGPAIHLCAHNSVLAGLEHCLHDGYTISSGAGGSHKQRPDAFSGSGHSGIELARSRTRCDLRFFLFILAPVFDPLRGGGVSV